MLKRLNEVIYQVLTQCLAQRTCSINNNDHSFSYFLFWWTYRQTYLKLQNNIRTVLVTCTRGAKRRLNLLGMSGEASVKVEVGGGGGGSPLDRGLRG